MNLSAVNEREGLATHSIWGTRGAWVMHVAEVLGANARDVPSR